VQITFVNLTTSSPIRRQLRPAINPYLGSITVAAAEFSWLEIVKKVFGMLVVISFLTAVMALPAVVYLVWTALNASYLTL
jgi:hypothetical protein